jgi:predicted double-glycine peptidase
MRHPTPAAQRELHEGPANHGEGPCCANPKPLGFLAQFQVQSRQVVGTNAEVGQELPDWLREARDKLVAKLTENDIPPARVEYNPNDPEAPWKHSLKFYFYTPFRAERAAEFLPPWIKPASDPPKMLKNVTHLRTLVIPETQVGQVGQVGQVQALNQETPYTCGPAALRAVLRHYGTDVSEDDAATAVANVPVLGARPHGMVRGAQELGLHAVASYFRDTKALRPFVTHDVPIIVIVDSFLKPGKQGHYVVVTDMSENAVTIMDPHKEGNWRKLSLHEFDARWWHRRPDENGEMEVAKRLAIIVVPEAVEPEVEAGNEKMAPVHGRIARCTGARGGVHKWGRKVIEGATKALATIFGGKTTPKVYDKAMDALYDSVQKLDNEKRQSWFNDAPNEDVYLWAVGYLKKCSTKVYGDKSARGKAMQEIMRALGIERDSYTGERESVSEAAFKLLLWYSNLKSGISPCIVEHALQAILILDYGPLAETWPIVEGALKQKPSEVDAAKLAPWVSAIMETLDEYRVQKGTTVAAVGGEYPPGVEGAVIELIERLSRLGLIPLKVSAAQLEEPAGLVDAVMFDFATQEQADRAADMLPEAVQGATKTVRVKTRVVDLKQDAATKHARTPTIRQKRFLDDARESDDVKVVLKAYFLARKLGMDEVAEALGKRHQALVEKTMPEEEEASVDVGAKKNVESSGNPEVEWIFDVEYLKQVWPLIEAKRADVPALKKALRTAENLEANNAFMFQADEESKAFVSNVLSKLRTQSLSTL